MENQQNIQLYLFVRIFFNSLQLQVSVTFDHHQGALLQSTAIQRYVCSSKTCLIYKYVIHNPIIVFYVDN